MSISREIKIGFFAVITIAIAIWGFKFLKGQNLLSPSKVVYVEFPNINISGLEVSSPISVNGLKVGVITDIRFKPDNVQNIIVTLSLDRKWEIPKTAVAELVSAGLMGNKEIHLVFSKGCTGNGDCVESGDYLKPNTKGLLGSLVTPAEMNDYLGLVKNNSRSIVDSLTIAIAENEKMKRTLSDLSQTIAHMNKLTANLDKVITTAAPSLNGTMSNLQGITANLNASNAEIKSMLSNANGFSSKLNNLDMQTTLKSTNETIEKLKKTLETANGTVGQLNGVVQNINDGDGTLGALLKDKTLYEEISRTSKNLDLLLQDFRLNPKRYTTILRKKSKEYTLPIQDPAKPILDSIKVRN